ncbi:hypothetical protein [Cryobacterium sp. GrIS_2_6]|uniref:hypothetical protein n=1 Tax=Cryobacterium sp. GrIS_2_6 TaxID=3162785 RepID=UPI002DFCDBDA|nr:hypothetical protein [Cryobacterium psychrotolerans]
MRKRTRFGLAGLAVIGLAALVVAYLPGHAEAAVNFSDPSVGFRDQASGAYLRIDLDSAAAGVGQFYFSAPGVGLVVPAKPATLDPHSAHDEQFRFDGVGTQYASAVLSSDIAQPVPSGASGTATIKVIGHDDPTARTANVEVWINGKHFTLEAAPAPHNAGPTLTAVITALKATDLGALYDLGDPSLRNGLTREQFVATIGATGGGSVTGLTPTGATTYVTTSAGADFALTPITFDYVKNGVPGEVTAHLRLIYTGGQWRYMTMQPDNAPANSDSNAPDPTVP